MVMAQIIDRKVKNFGFDNTRDYPYKGTQEQKSRFIDRKSQIINSENAKKLKKQA